MVVPVRTFINRREVDKNIMETSIQPINEKTVELKFARVKRIVLSNHDLRAMYGEMHPKLVKLLFDYNESELRSVNKFTEGESAPDMLKLPLITEHWTCYLVISMEDLMQLRSMMDGQLADTDRPNMVCQNLLIREMVFNSSPRSSSDELLDEDSKNVSIKYKGRYVVPIPLNVHVYARN